VPTGTVAFADGGIPRGTAPLISGTAMLDSTLAGVGIHIIMVQFSGDAAFLPSSSRTEVQVTSPATMLTLMAPANAAPGSPVTLTAAINSAGGTPTGQIVFHDGNTGLGTAPLNAVGVAALTINTLTAGAHSLTASYAGDGNFGGITSIRVSTTIASRDFSLGVAPPSSTTSTGTNTTKLLRCWAVRSEIRNRNCTRLAPGCACCCEKQAVRANTRKNYNFSQFSTPDTWFAFLAGPATI
jgi:hypothetical protein